MADDTRHDHARDLPKPGGPGKLEQLARMLRVDHAGETAAVKIYQGQLAVLGKSPATRRTAAHIRHMEAQEEEHLALFDDMLPRRAVRPTVMNPVWNVAGFTLGAVTALIGEKAAMACTEAVEEVIDDHYAGQIAELGDDESELKATLERLRAEEAQHRQTAIDEGAHDAPGHSLLTGIIKAGCRAAIKISERV